LTFIVDTSVAVKWFVPEVLSSGAKAILSLDRDRLAPDLLLAETANALWRKVRAGDIGADQVRDALVALPRYLDHLVPVRELISQSFELAQELQHSVYDCLYLGCALQTDDATVVTADRKFASKAAAAGYAKRIHLLGDEESGK
jgi:predicted nucleic acid-binding protein